jgi:hypothetical protein
LETKAGQSTFSHVVDWGRQQIEFSEGDFTFNGVGEQMAGIESEGLLPSSGGNAKYGEGVYTFPSVKDAMGLASPKSDVIAPRPVATFGVDPRTTVEYIKTSDGRMYALLKGPSDVPVKPIDLQWINVTPEQLSVYQKAMERRMPEESLITRAMTKVGDAVDTATPVASKALTIAGFAYASTDVIIKTVETSQEKGAALGVAQAGKTAATHSMAFLWVAVGGVFMQILVHRRVASPLLVCFGGALIATGGIKGSDRIIDEATPGLR